nr:Dihydrofolate reductase [uncultured bacterium]
MRLTIVVAMDRNRVIGKNGDIPWAGKLRADMEHFKQFTMGKVVVMGRKTYDSIPARFKPLSGRENIVLTKNLEFKALGCAVFHEVEPVEMISVSREVCVLGGAEIYKLFFEATDELIVTEVDTEVLGGDTFFPEILPVEWDRRVLFRQEVDEKNQFSFTVCQYTRVLEM